MAVADQTAEGIEVYKAPTIWSKIGAGLSLVWRSRVATVGLFMVLFWIFMALFADNCIVAPRCWVPDKGVFDQQEFKTEFKTEFKAEFKTTLGDDYDTETFNEIFNPAFDVAHERALESYWYILPLDRMLDEFKGDFEPTPWLARYSPFKPHTGDYLQGPTAKHWLGTDKLGRDLYARLMHGSRIILTVAPFSILIALIIGGGLGVIAGYLGGLVDEIIMRILDALMAFPQILLYLVIIAALGATVLNIIIAITLAGIPGIARMVRGLTLDIKTRDYVAAAQTRGESAWYIMLVEILPNASGPIIIDAMLRVGYAIFAIGTLGFIGLGLPPPSPDWGSMVLSGRGLIQAGYPWEALWPSLAIATLVVGLNLLADGLNEESQRYR